MKVARLVLGTLMAAGLSAGTACAQDKPIELKFSSWVSAVHGHHTGVMVPWAKMIEEKSGGRLKVTIFRSTLGKPAVTTTWSDGIAIWDSPRLPPGRFPLISVAEYRCSSSRRGRQPAVVARRQVLPAEFRT
jgi:hypothetical protein